MGRLRGVIWLLAGLVVAILAAVVAFVTLNRAAMQRADQSILPEIQVVVAARAVSVRTRLSSEDVEPKGIPVDLVPDGAAQAVGQVVGKVTLTELVPGEVILQTRLTDPNVIAPDGRQALVLSEGEVLFALPVSGLISKAGILKPGDHIDLLFTIDVPIGIQYPEAGSGESPTTLQENKPATVSVLRNLVIAAVVTDTATGENPSETQGVLLTVSPQDALVLKYVKDIDGIVDIVVRAPSDDLPTDVEPVDSDYLIRRYRIPKENGP
jgi:pilus assembly protein CpaB